MATRGSSCSPPASPPSPQRLVHLFDDLLAQQAACDAHTALCTEAAAQQAHVQQALIQARQDALHATAQRDAATKSADQVLAAQDVQLRQLRNAKLQLGRKLEAAVAAKDAAERAVAAANARIASAEAAANAKARDLGDLTARSQRLLAGKQAALADAEAAANAAVKEAQQVRAEAAEREARNARDAAVMAAQVAGLQGELAAERAAHDHLRSQNAQLGAASTELRTSQKALTVQVAQMEALLAESERERCDLRAKYLRLGEKAEALVAQSDAAAQQATAARASGEVAEARAAAAEARAEELAQELLQARAQLETAERRHRRAATKLDRKLVHLADRFERVRQDAAVKSQQLEALQQQLDQEVQAHVSTSEQQALEASGQQVQVEELTAQLAATQQEADRAVAAAEARVFAECSQQQTALERQVQDLQLQVNCLNLLDTAAAARTVVNGNGNSSDTTNGAHVGTASLPYTTNGASGLPALLTSTLQRRMEAQADEWRGRHDAEVAAAEERAASSVRQVGAESRQRIEQLQSRCAELEAARTRLQEALQCAQTEAAASSKEAHTAKQQLEEQRSANRSLSARLEEAQRTMAHMHGFAAQPSVHLPSYAGARLDPSVIASLVAKTEINVQERCEALQAAATAQGRVKVLEEEVSRLSDRLSQSQRELEAAHGDRRNAQAHAKHAAADSTRQATALQASEAALQGQVKALEGEKKQLAESLQQAVTRQKEADMQQAGLQASIRALQLDRAALEERLAAVQVEAQRAAEERDYLTRVTEGLTSSIASDRKGLASVVEGLEASWRGLQDHASWYECRRAELSAGLSPLPGSPRRKRSLSPTCVAARPLLLAPLMDFTKGSFNVQEVEVLIQRFDQERRALATHSEALEAESFDLRHRLRCVATTERQLAAQVEEQAKQLAECRQQAETDRQAAEQQQRQAAAAASAVADALRAELAATSAARQAAHEAASAAEQQVTTLQTTMSDLRVSLAAAEARARETGEEQMQRVSAALDAQLAALQGRLGVFKEDVAAEVAGVAREVAAKLQELDEHWQQHLTEVAAAHAAAAAAADALHTHRLAQAAKRVNAWEVHNEELLAQQAQLCQRLLGIKEVLLQLLELQGCDSAAVCSNVLVGEGHIDTAGAIISTIQAVLTAVAHHAQAALEERCRLQAAVSAALAEGAAFKRAAQRVVATVAVHVPLKPDLQEALITNAVDGSDACLEALHQELGSHYEGAAAKVWGAAEAAMQLGPLAEMARQADSARQEASAHAQALAALRCEQEECAARHGDTLVRCKMECMDGAARARDESLAPLHDEVQGLKLTLQALEGQHACEVRAVMDAAERQVAAQANTAEQLVHELQAALNAAQRQLTQETERADVASATLNGLQSEAERRVAADVRKDRRQTGELEALRGHVRDLEARHAEREGELQSLKRALRQRELESG